MKPFLSATLCSAFTFRPASFPAVTARLAERLLFCQCVCVCVCVCVYVRSYLVFVYERAYSPPTHLGSRVIPGNPPSESV